MLLETVALDDPDLSGMLMLPMPSIFGEGRPLAFSGAARMLRGLDLAFGDLLARWRARLPMEFALVGRIDVNA